MITKEKIIEILGKGLSKFYNQGFIDKAELADKILALDKEIKPDYEILSFKQDSGMTDLWTYFNNQGWARNNNGKMETKPYKTLHDILNNHFYGNIKYNINSVKRLSDGEVFTIGDKVICGNLAQINPLLKIETSNCNDGIYLLTQNYYGCSINHVIKAKTPILVTEDGKELFKGDYFYHVDSNWDIGKGFLSKDTFEKLKGYKEFSNKEVAEKYIFENKPCLSYKDLINSVENNELLKSIMAMRIFKLVVNKLK